jgi:Hypothetical chloroplast protein Ycf34
MKLTWLFAFHFQFYYVACFFHQSVPQTHSPRTDLRCICINCKYVTNCAAYHFVEEKHQQRHISDNPTFEPRDGSPTIHVNMRPIVGRDDEEKRMLLEHKQEEERARAAAVHSALTADMDEATKAALIGQTVYDMRPEVSLEYDVVKCEDFVEDIGCWIRNMPEAIRLANPNFVPT